MDWAGIFHLTMPLPELLLRGSLTFLTLYFLLRIVGRREAASVNMTDVLVIVLVADAASMGMNGGSETLGDGFVLILTILFWSVALDFLGYRFPRAARLIKANPEKLVEDGELVDRTLRHEFMTKDEVLMQLRLHGIEDIGQVRRAYLEPNGGISILSRADDKDAQEAREHNGTRGSTDG